MWKRASAALYGTRTSSSGRRFASPFAENGAGREQLNALYKVTNKVQRRRHFTRLRAPWRESRRQKARGLDLVYGKGVRAICTERTLPNVPVLTGIRYSDPMIRARRWRPRQPAQKHVNDHGDSTFVNNPFLEDLLEWRHSPEGEQFAELADALCDLIDDMRLDAKQLHNGSISSSPFSTSRSNIATSAVTGSSNT
jgi:hypothetical protein